MLTTLAITRKTGERIYLLNGSIVVEVLRIIGDRARLGITADRSIDVYREELWVRLSKPDPSEENTKSQQRS